MPSLLQAAAELLPDEIGLRLLSFGEFGVPLREDVLEFGQLSGLLVDIRLQSKFRLLGFLADNLCAFCNELLGNLIVDGLLSLRDRCFSLA